jgi:hypothetical protein
MSARSNENRLGVDEALLEHQEAPPMEAANGAVPDPQLKFVIPTDFVALPSKGRFYPPNHPLHNKEVIEVRHMTAKDEDILTSTTLLKQGVALDRMLQNLLVDKTVNVKDLVLGDKNALIVSTRINGYGAAYLTEVGCPSCGAKQEYSFDLSSLETNEVPEVLLEEYDITISPNSTFLLPLPKTEYMIELKLLSGHDEEKLTSMAKSKKKHRLMETTTTDQLKAIIVSVNGVSDRSVINEFIGVLPAIDSRYIRRIYQKIMPTVDLAHDFTCGECGHESRLEVPFTTDFFWPVR